MGFIQPGRSLKKRKIKKSQSPHVVQYAPPNKSILEKFPHELLYRVFVLTGLKENNLSLTNKYFNKVLSLNSRRIYNTYWPGKRILLDIVDIHFTYDLNQNINIPKIKKKIQYYTSKIPGNGNENLRNLKEGIKVFEEISSALSADLFNYKFISSEFLDLFNLTKSHALEYNVILEEIKERPKFIKENDKALMKECKRMNVSIPESEDECDNMARMADQLFNSNTPDIVPRDSSPDNQENNNTNKYSYATYTKSPKLSAKFYDNITQKRLILMSKMCHFGFIVEDIDKLFINTIRSFDRDDWEMEYWRDSFDVLLDLSKSVIPTSAIIEGFESITACKPQNKQHYYTITNRLLELYFREDQRNGVDDSSIWYYIVSTKNHKYFDMIMNFAGKPSNEILALMHT
ncbi:DEHA2D12958p [Debaryomyces hansenii CBS767]|jgi:hypothetical protein|uniref:DEHA2D12958p n=1 Tax=Debaryomyces hansenii (strain ATCC 36239 / CBS 767 / BCRC 21394 / JCM 1990 / NBRC 0083 / IGC 2968) TaxID=284592 RepID=Q6BRY3_DEBHA|nr:DEHA2D12958p [Debaryomyces hansenii CBS767]CAG87205.1 DEHA2D12958p [Debaryomyces hansenii CBS767]|eukprot:XP_459037.1 DEHA2D12958p [Debaryomyces hansenii CBS767]